MMKKLAMIGISGLVLAGVLSGCSQTQSADQIQQQQQAQIDSQATVSVGMPAITNFTERKELKMIYELRDKANLTTYMYTQNQMDGKWVYQGEAVGFPIPYSTEYTNPSYYSNSDSSANAAVVLPQADPNGLFSSPNTAADWIMRIGPSGLYPAYMEPNVYVSPTKIPAYLCESYSIPKGY